MENMSAKEAVRELTMMLLYLTRLTNEKDFQTAKDFFAWKSYDWDTIDDLVESGMICQGKKSNKSVLITEEGKEYASALLKNMVYQIGMRRKLGRLPWILMEC